MKKIYLLIAAAAGMLFAACSPEDIFHPSEKGLPTLDGIEANITIDDSLNQVNFALPAGTKGLIPIWIFQDKDGNWTNYAAQDGLNKIYGTAGDYPVRMKVMNRNGVSDEYKEYTFHVKNSKVDFKKYLNLICGGTEATNSKEWRMESEVAGHFGCGPSGTTGTEWWSAGVDEKKGVGIYDNRLTFEGDYKYTFNPGDAGTMYVNNGVTGIFGSEYEKSEDYNVPVTATTTDFSFEVSGEDVFVTFPAHTPFLYVPYAESWESPRFRLESITAKEMHLIADNGSIAWHFTLTSGAATHVFNGYNYEGAANIWRPIDETQSYTTSFWYAPGWSQIADPGFTQSGSNYTFSLPEATTDTWQAQCFIIPESLQLSSATHYDFSCVINSSTDNPHVTIKLVDKTDDGNFLFAENVAVKAYEDYVFYLTDLAGIDADCKLVLDFGGNGAGCEATVSRITLKDHAVDDGTVLPTEEPVATVDWREADNLLKGMQFTPFYYYAPGWSQIADPEVTVSNNTYKISLPTATTDQWQAQYHMKSTGISLSSEEAYDFRVKLNSTTDINKVTIKLCEDGDDGLFILDEEKISLKAYEDYTYEGVGLVGKDISNLKIVFDFGGNPEGTEVTISDMLLQTHAGATVWDASSSDNMFTEDCISSMFYYYAPGWSQIANPELTHSTGSYIYKLSYPSATTDQWQAQTAFKTNLSTNAADTYDFHCTLTPNQDIKGVTVKLTMEGDDNTFYFADRVDLKAYETYDFSKTGMAGLDIPNVNLFFDFGGNPADFEIEVADIILKKH